MRNKLTFDELLTTNIFLLFVSGFGVMFDGETGCACGLFDWGAALWLLKAFRAFIREILTRQQFMR